MEGYSINSLQSRNTVEVDASSGESPNDDRLTFTESLNSTIINYEWKNGRRYHDYGSGSYKYPNDEREQERLDMVHFATYLLLDERLFLAPFRPERKRVLDVGTAAGRWAIEMGEHYPEADVTGIDLSPIQPRWTPPNVKFIVEDVEEDWIEGEVYDFIHCRYMMGAIRDWPRLIEKFYRHLKPGGWVEFKDATIEVYSEDDTVQPDYAITEMLRALSEASTRLGVSLEYVPHVTTWMAEAGFQNIDRHVAKMPIGTWPKDKRLKLVGALMAAHYVQGVEAFTFVLLREIMDWPQADIEALNARVRAVAQRKSIHAMND
ncbi:hypothetical protein FQN53_005014 [Emmonsiellopsis sp. PD_33]|nr:hypothetical protein FQN53_005014 [Emmonsiellopsis sp. PD_33]